MAISDTIQSMTTNITNAYTKIADKGGTIPANKNLQNLANAIDSIAGGCTVESVDNGDDTQTLVIVGAQTAEDAVITSANIGAYKYYDEMRLNIFADGSSSIATDTEYANAEEYLQGVYRIIMGVSNNE